MLYKKVIRKHLEQALGSISGLKVFDGDSHRLDKDSFTDIRGERQSYLLISTGLVSAEPDTAKRHGHCRSTLARVSVDLRIMTQLREGATDALDDIEELMWREIAILDPFPGFAKDIEMEFESDSTQPSDSEAAIPTISRVIQFAVEGEFNPEDSTTLT